MLENEQSPVEVDVDETEGLKQANAALQDRLQAQEKSMAEKDEEIAVIKKVAEDFKEKYAKTDQALGAAIKAYLAFVTESNPGVAAEMIQGETIEEIDASVKNARALLVKVRQQVGAENAKARVPAGAPPRTPPDISGLSPREKIKYGMGKG
jgi:hypothetical protein